ncbi:MAG: alpha/beta hydrolase family protein [Microbacteriaceae bacterium]
MKPNEPHSIAGRIVGIAGIALLGAAAVASVAAAAVTVLVARAVVTPPTRREQDIRLIDVTPTSVTLSRTPDTETPGRYGLWFDGSRGHARIGDIISVDGRGITRELVGVDYGQLRPDQPARLSAWFYLHPTELGLAFSEVLIPTALGAAPAWFVPAEGSSSRWVIQVHGRAVQRQEALRAVQVFHDAGYSSLLISYRNDGDAPRSVDYRYGLGDSEWLDVDAAIDFALDHGAAEIVLMGWSMGGATVLQAATRSRHAASITGIVLDSPVIDWVGVLEFQGTVMHLPRFIRRGALAVISREWGRRLTGQSEAINLSRLDFVARAAELNRPVLLLHSDDDGYVPADGSRALALSRPDIVTFEQFDTARHTKLWNYNEPRWNAAIARWLNQLTPGHATPPR